jgi:hypothetical protein
LTFSFVIHARVVGLFPPPCRLRNLRLLLHRVPPRVVERALGFTFRAASGVRRRRRFTRAQMFLSVLTLNHVNSRLSSSSLIM